MFNSDPKSPLNRIVAALAGLILLGFGFRAIFWLGDLHYTNWLGELVFAPLAILFGLIIILGALLGQLSQTIEALALLPRIYVH